MAVRKAQVSLWGRGSAICAAAQAVRVTVTLQSACKREDADIKRIDCCGFGSGTENGKEELKKMN